MIKIVQRRKIWFIFSLVLISVSIAALLVWGLKLGIDFTGGTLMEFSFKNETLNSQEIKDAVKDLGLGEVNIQFSEGENVLLRFKDVDEDTHQKIIEALGIAVSEKGNIMKNNNNLKEKKNNEDVEDKKGEEITSLSSDKSANADSEEMLKISNSETKRIEVSTDNNSKSDSKSVDVDLKKENLKKDKAIAKAKNNIEEKRFDSIGPVIGEELKSSAFWAVLIALVAIVLYIGWAFRKVSRPVSSFKYGIVAMIALFHDIIITLGVFSVLGYVYNVEVGIPFVAALLAILGYSVNDTIVVFDRTRENLLKSGIDDFEEVVNKSVNETMIRSLNTSFTTLLILFTLYLFGGATIKYFVVALVVGITAGTYSSIFIASPLLVVWQRWSLKRR
jgi:preprotein translocase subunit SecF